jgi:hypothetical protein
MLVFLYYIELKLSPKYVQKKNQFNLIWSVASKDIFASQFLTSLMLKYVTLPIRLSNKKNYHLIN